MIDLILTVYRFFKSHFNWKLYLAHAAFCGLIIYFYYGIDYEHTIFASWMYNRFYKFAFYTAFYAFAFYGVIFISKYFSPIKCINLDQSFWIKSFLTVMILGFNETTYCYTCIRDQVPLDLNAYTCKIFSNSSSILFTLTPIFIIFLLFDRKKVDSFYGMTLKGVNFKPLLGMFLIMLPIVALASFTKDFQSYYPIYKRAHGADVALYYNISEVIPAGIFEIVYLSDFINTELFFRGFLILAFSRYLGVHVVLPMTLVYSMIHFGKPALETVSAIIGGYILGIKVFESKNIWCGVVIHMGIAFLMEVFAFLHMIH